MTQVSIFPRLILGTFSSPTKLWQKEMQENKNSSIEEFLLRKVLSFYVVVFILEIFTKSIYHSKSYLNTDTFLPLISIFFIISLVYLFFHSFILYFLAKFVKKIDFEDAIYVQFYVSVPIALSLIFKYIPYVGKYVMMVLYIYYLYLFWKSLKVFLNIDTLKQKLQIFIPYALITNIFYTAMLVLKIKMGF